MTTIPRRQLLTGLASLLAAPAIVRASSLMPVVPVRPLRGPPMGPGWRVVELQSQTFQGMAFWYPMTLTNDDLIALTS